MTKINPKSAEYIKLGREGCWEGLFLEEGTIRFGYAGVPHVLALSGDQAEIKRHFPDKGFAPTTASNHVRSGSSKLLHLTWKRLCGCGCQGRPIRSAHGQVCQRGA